MWAARGHHVEVFSYLADKGADLSIRDGLNHDFWDISASNYQENYSRSSKIQAMARRYPQYDAGVAVLTNEAKAFAKLLAKEYRGRSSRCGVAYTHAEVEVRATYRGMQCRFAVFAGGFDLWIQNFRIEDMIISLNIEGRDNETLPQEMHGMLGLDGIFSEHFPVYHFPSMDSKAAAIKFFAAPENIEDLKRLGVGRYEWMAMVPGQLRLRNQAADMEIVRTRVDSLANIFERHHKPAQPVLLPQRYSIRYSMSEDVQPQHRFGGALQKKIKCPQCGEDFCQIASFDAGDERLAGIKWKRKRIVAALCPVCSLYDTSSLTCVSYAGKAPAVLFQSDQSGNGEPEQLLFGYVLLSPVGKRAGEFKSRMGGEPGWIQGDDTPVCPCCKEPMRFFVQFISEDGVVFGADEGTAYIFLCQPCLVVGVAIQAH